MSTGYLTIDMLAIKASGYFENGKLVHGKLQMADVVYAGEFNERMLLHGEGYITFGQKTYAGTFENGILQNGETIVDEKVIESGEYTFSIGNKIPHLAKGTKYLPDKTLTGSFDRQGQLTEGTYIVDNVTYTGNFSDGNMYEGTAIYKFGENTFEVTYKLEYDMALRQYLFAHCDVKWTGTISELTPKLLTMVCCNGARNAHIHRTYISFLHKFDSNTIRYLHLGLFQNLNAVDYTCIRFIIDNLREYPDYIGNDNVNIRPSTELMGTATSMIDQPKRKREYDH